MASAREPPDAPAPSGSPKSEVEQGARRKTVYYRRTEVSAEQPEKFENSSPESREAREEKPDGAPAKSGSCGSMNAVESICPSSGHHGTLLAKREASSLSNPIQSQDRLRNPRVVHRLGSCAMSALESPESWISSLPELVDEFLLVAKHHEIDTGLRTQCLNAIAELITKSAPTFTRSLARSKLADLVTCLLDIVVEGAHFFPALWTHALQKDSLLAKQALLRLLLSPNGAALVPVAAERIGTMLQDWGQRPRGLAALAALCHKDALLGCARGREFTRVLVDINFDLVFSCLCDRELDICNAAITVFGQTISCLSPGFAYSTNATIVPDILALLTIGGQAEVMSIAGKMLMHYFSSCSREVAMSHVKEVCKKLNALTRNKAPDIPAYMAFAEAVLTTVVAMADALQTSFQAFYSDFVPPLMELIALLGASKCSGLQWLALDCVAHIGVAVGRQQFTTDALIVKQAVLSLLTDRWHCGNDHILGQAMSVALQLNRVLNEERETFMMQLVLGAFPILARGDHQLVEFNKKVCALFEWCAFHAQERFTPHIRAALSCMLPLMWDVQPSVRECSSECFAWLLSCASECCETCISDRFLAAHLALSLAIDGERELCPLVSKLCALQQILRLISLPFLPSNHIAYITASLDTCLEFYFRWNPPADYSSAPSDRHELSARATEEDDGLLQALLHEASDVVCTLLSQLRDAYFPFFDSLAPFVYKLLTEPRPWTEHLHGLSIITELLRLGPSACDLYRSYYMPEIVRRLDSNMPLVKIAAAQAVAALAQQGGQEFAAPCVWALPALTSAIAGPRAPLPEQSLVAEASMVALSRILEHHWDTTEIQAQADGLLLQFLSWLPVMHGSNQGPALELFCSLLERGDPVAKKHIGCLVLVMVDALNYGRVAEGSPLAYRIKACLQFLTWEVVADRVVWVLLQDTLSACAGAGTGGNAEGGARKP